MALAVNTRLGPYQITAPLGAGGMGEVYKARDTRLNRDVAIKILRPDAAADAARQILTEARAAARLNHPNIATLHDVVDGVTTDGVALPPFLVMEFVDGRPLSEIVAGGPCDVDRALDIGIQLAGALAAAHREGIIHRDVKPANVMITPDGSVKLLDLGLASVVAGDPSVTTRTSLPSTMEAEQRGGTPAYMAPEQLAGTVPDACSDVYSTGVLLFELLTGRRPFVAADLMTLAIAVATKPVPLVSSVCPGVSPAVDAVVARAMAKDRAERFGTAAELRDALVAAREGTSVATPARSAWRRRVVGLSAALAIGVMALTAFWWSRHVPHAVAPIAILPVVSAGDPVLDTLGVGLVSMLRDNLASAPGLTVVSTAGLTTDYRGSGRNLASIARELGAGYLVDLRVSGSPARVRVAGSLVEAGHDTPVWQGTYEGDSLSVNRWVSDQVATSLEEIGIFPRRLTAADREKMRRLPTADGAAFAAYAQGQARLDTAKDAADVGTAIASLQDAVTRDGSFALARAALSTACVRMYGYTSDEAWIARAATEANQALAIDPDRAQVHYSLAIVYQDTGRLADALQHAQEAVRLSPTSDEAHRLLGSLLGASGETDKAIAELNLAIQLRPNYARNHATLGYVLYKAARYQQAVGPYRRASELQPTAANFAALGTALHASGNIQEAIGNYKHAVELGSNPRAYSNLAFSYYTAGNFAEALANWQEALRLDKAPPPTRYRNLGDAYERLGRQREANAAYAEAITRAEQLLKVNPADVDQIAIIAVCEAKLGRHDEAALRAAEALGLKPADSDVLFKAAVVAALGGRRDDAIRNLDKALAAGYPRAFARNDFDLQQLGNDPRFAALVAQRDE